MQFALVIHPQNSQDITSELLPKGVHVIQSDSYRAAEKELQQLQIQLVCVETETLDAATQNFIAFLHDCFFSVRLVVVLRNPSEMERTQALELGADECVGCSCYRAYLKVKLRHLLQLQKLQTLEVLTAGNIALMPHSGELWLDDLQVAVRRREAQILQCLLQYKNRVVTRKMIIDHVWLGEEDIPADVTIDVYIRRIRMILRQYQNSLETVRGFGYRLSEPSTSA